MKSTTTANKVKCGSGFLPPLSSIHVLGRLSTHHARPGINSPSPLVQLRHIPYRMHECISQCKIFSDFQATAMGESKSESNFHLRHVVGSCQKFVAFSNAVAGAVYAARIFLLTRRRLRGISHRERQSWLVERSAAQYTVDASYTNSA